MAVPSLVVANNADYYRTGRILADGVGYNLYGHSLAIEVRQRAQDTTVYISIDSTPDPGGIVIAEQAGATIGQFSFLFARDRLEKMAQGEYVYDIVMTTPSGLQQNLGIAPVTVVHGVTRDD